jgi:hypothetical protein
MRSAEPPGDRKYEGLSGARDDRMFFKIKWEASTHASRFSLHLPASRLGNCRYAAWLALFGCLLSIVFWLLPTFTLICFGLASAFLASVTFSTPLS